MALKQERESSLGMGDDRVSTPEVAASTGAMFGAGNSRRLTLEKRHDEG
jgi:hypothetical protein